MPFPTKPGIHLTHALAIVDHLHQSAPTVLHQQGDFGGAGIEAIFQQFLYGIGGTLHNFSCSNLIGYRIGQ